MFSSSFAAQPDKWDLQVLKNYYVNIIALTTVEKCWGEEEGEPTQKYSTFLVLLSLKY